MAGPVSGDTEAQYAGDPSSKPGGWITFPFMMATLLGMSITSFGWVLNLIVFLIEEFNIKSIAAAQISNIVNGCLSMLPLVAAILADSFFGNILVISASTFISLTGILLLTLVASLDFLKPTPCETGSNLCQSPSEFQLGILYTALVLVTIGAGGTRFTLASAGANQYDKPKDQGSFFNWYFLTLYAGAITGATAIVYTQDNASWKLGFGLCAAANFVSFVVFVCGKRLYKHEKPMGSPFKSLISVVVAATVKRKAAISSKEEDYHQGLAKTSPAMPSKSYGFLNRAALKTEDGGSVNNIWRVCSVQEVEDFKAILRLLPLWVAIIFVSTPMVMQTSLMVLQALVTDRALGPHFKVPAGSLQVIIMTSASTFIIINNWLVYPIYQKLTGKRLTPLQKVGIGQVLTILSMAVSAVVEAKRLKTVENGHPMSVLWLNTATSLTSLVIGVSFYLSTALISLLQRTTKWLPNDINKGRVDNVYWVLVVAGVLNFGYFLVCSWFYTYRNLQGDNEQHPKDVST
ncbi:BnaA02g13640D [Brassica napus]|uniref:BnaA02g13640D protein n=1 Tax=Brassica napus TaxID=3708 RepID=A0A078FHL5_BRANA|nr:BnaA02g13640D [Brassica napus]